MNLHLNLGTMLGLDGFDNRLLTAPKPNAVKGDCGRRTEQTEPFAVNGDFDRRTEQTEQTEPFAVNGDEPTAADDWFR